MKKFTDYLQRKQIEYGSSFDDSELSKQFVPYYENQKRIEVKMSWGEILRGRVGITTGWRPVFLLMLKVNSTGSSIILTDDDVILKVIE